MPLLLFGALGDGARCGPSTPRVPAQRIVSLGFEDVIAGASRLAQLARRLDEVDATGITLGVGRSDWTAFPWPALPEAESSPVRKTGRDFVAEAITALSTSSTGRVRTVGLVIDVLAPLMLQQNPSLAGIDDTGQRSDEFASLQATTAGPIADRLLAMTGYLAERYRPTSLSFTELFFDDATFGPDDLRSFRTHSGQTRFPRGADGRIMVNDPRVAAWRSWAVSSFVSRAHDTAARHDVPFDIDVRVSWIDPTLGRPESGHDYPLLLAAADRLVLWDYFALSNKPADYSYDIAVATEGRHPGRFVISVGLWVDGPADTIAPSQLKEALTAAARGGAQAVAVIPTVLMTAAHWKALQGAWTP